MTLKGRVAATIQSSDELVLTELIFNSGFKARILVSDNGTVPLMSCTQFSVLQRPNHVPQRAGVNTCSAWSGASLDGDPWRQSKCPYCSLCLSANCWEVPSEE